MRSKSPRAARSAALFWLLVASAAPLLPHSPLPQTARDAGGADFTGVERFLELTAKLERDEEPTDQDWDRLFSTPGYTVLLEREFGRDFFAERFRLAFMPSKKEAFEARLKTDTGFWAQFLPHFRKAKEMRADIEKRVAELREMDIHGAAVARAKALLPPEVGRESPRVAFLIFGPDARGYDPVVIDVLYSLTQKDRFADFVAHEFHHWYRNRMIDLGQDADTLWTINQIQAEGIADLVDRADWPKKPAPSLTPAQKAYRSFYDRSPETIRAMDEILVRMAGVPIGRGALGAQLRKLVPLSGHPTGLYMAGLILAELGRDTLVGSVSNPFEFFRLYDAAAAKRSDDTPRLSPAALSFLSVLEKHYLK